MDSIEKNVPTLLESFVTGGVWAILSELLARPYEIISHPIELEQSMASVFRFVKLCCIDEALLPSDLSQILGLRRCA